MVEVEAGQKTDALPAAFVGFIITMIACARAYSALEKRPDALLAQGQSVNAFAARPVPGRDVRVSLSPQTVEAIRSINRRTP